MILYEGSIEQAAAQMRVYANRNDDGTVFCWVGGSAGRDQTAFLRALREVLRPIENPRYFLARKQLWRVFREDYFAVPDILALLHVELLFLSLRVLVTRPCIR
jgi:hypothetical protein